MFLYDNMIKGELQTEDGFMIVSIKQEPSPTDVTTEPEEDYPDASQQLNVMPEIKTEQQDKSEPDYDVKIDPSNDNLDRCDVCNKRLTTNKSRETESETRSRFTTENYLEPGKQSTSSPSESTVDTSTTPRRNPSRSAKKNSVNYVNDLEANLQEDGSINSDDDQCWKCSKDRTEPKKVHCDICDKTFTQNRSLQIHIITVHDKVKAFQCDYCDKKFTQNSSLQVHIRTIHDQVKSFKCDICDKKFAQRSSLKSHSRVHDKLRAAQCPHCPYKATQNDTLEQHLLTHLICDICDKKFNTRFFLKQHIRTVHERIKAFQCDICDTKFSVSSSLKKHIRAVHDKIKPFPCPHLNCPYKAAQRGKLKIHLRTHTGEKNFKCHICIGDKKFSERTQLKRHIRRVHAMDISLGLYNNIE